MPLDVPIVPPIDFKLEQLQVILDSLEHYQDVCEGEIFSAVEAIKDSVLEQLTLKVYELDAKCGFVRSLENLKLGLEHRGERV